VRKSEQGTLGTRDADQSAPAAKEPGERLRYPSAGMTPEEGARYLDGMRDALSRFRDRSGEGAAKDA
jgi:hypothetical protein